MPEPSDHAVRQRLVIDLDRPSPSTAVCTVRGEIDLATEATFRNGLEGAVGAAPTIVVDLCEVTFIGSIAAAIIIEVLRGLNDLQALKLVTGPSSALVFRILGLTDMADCFSNRSSI